LILSQFDLIRGIRGLIKDSLSLKSIDTDRSEEKRHRAEKANDSTDIEVKLVEEAFVTEIFILMKRKCEELPALYHCRKWFHALIELLQIREPVLHGCIKFKRI